MNYLAVRIVLLFCAGIFVFSDTVNAQDLDELLKGALKDYLEEKAEDAGINIPGRGQPKNVDLRFTGAEAPSTETFEALYSVEETPSTAPTTPSTETAAETACYNLVQNRIAWNTSGSKSWNPKNIRKLCDGATVAAAPPACFSTAMFRGSAWGKKPTHKMNWMLATQLCAKATSASAPITCLKSRLRANYSLQNAVNACDTNPRTVAVRPRPTPTPAPRLQESECYSYVQGRIAWDAANKNKNWNKTNVQRLCKGTTSKYSPGNCFTYAMHQGAKWGKRPGDVMNWSKAIDLCEGTSNAKKTTTCFKNLITAGKSVDQAVARCDR